MQYVTAYLRIIIIIIIIIRLLDPAIIIILYGKAFSLRRQGRIKLFGATKQ